MNLFIFIVGLVCAVSETSAQYYYVSAGQPALFQFRSDYNSFPQQYSTFHGNQQFSNFHGSQPFSTFHGHQQVYRAQVPTAPPVYIPSVTSAPPVQTQHRVNQNDVPEYRGFAYQTTLDNNAVSHVLFVSGPESQKFTSRVFSSMTSPQNAEVEKARSIASDLVDPVKNNEYSSTKNLENVYTPHTVDFDNPENSFSNFFHSPRSFSSVVNFYSSPKAGLFARPVSGYPADTVPLQAPPTGTLLNLFGSNLETTETTTTESTIANDDDTVVIDNAEAQESIMTNTRFRLNDLVVPRGKSLELSNEKLTMASATEKDTVTEKIEPVEDNILSTEATTKSLEFTGTTTAASELVTTETVKGTIMMDTSEPATNMMPTAVTEKAVTTVNEPSETSDKPMPTTNESVEILQTSGQSAPIMDQFEQATDQSISTTAQSISTTVQSISTTAQSISTTAQSFQTTELLAQTTEQLAQTTDQSTAEIRDQSIATTRQSVPTTEQSVQTSGQSAETTNQADPTTVMAETTAANASEGTAITEETGTTARIATTTTV